MKLPLIAFLSIWMWVVQAHRGAVISVGYSSGFTGLQFDHGKWRIYEWLECWYCREDLEMENFYSGIGITQNLSWVGKQSWVVHRQKIGIFPKNSCTNRLQNHQLEMFKLIAMGGVQVSYIWSIQENALGLNHDTMKDFQLGALFGGGRIWVLWSFVYNSRRACLSFTPDK